MNSDVGCSNHGGRETKLIFVCSRFAAEGDFSVKSLMTVYPELRKREQKDAIHTLHG